MTKDIRKGCILVPLFHHVRFSQQKRFGTVCLRYCLRDWEEKGLDVADFRGCGFENTSFAGAVLTNAVFPAQSVPFLDIDAQRKHDAAVQAHDEIFYKYGVGNPSAQCDAEVLLADLAIEKAKKEQEDAEQALRAAKAEAERRSRNVEIRKRLMRNSADKDTTYVVYQARIECTYGMRESYLSLKSTHGVMTREIPQMTVKDARRNTNIINFGGCRSMGNPSVERAAKRVENGANARIELKKDGRDTAAAVVKAARIAICPGKAIIEHFLSTFKKEEDELESLKRECIGECTACFPANAAWEKGHEKVTINGEQVLLRRCTMRCNYGGRITILLSGQPE